MALMAAALSGMGVILWVAANWADWGRPARFGVLQAFVALSLVGAWALAAARVPLALLGFLGIGGLLAYFGQTYQTGADPWQLFALWAALGLPLCVATRHDTLWTPWALVVTTAVSLWLHARAGHRWSVEANSLPGHLLAWAALGAVGLGLSPVLSRLTGAGLWAHRTALTLALFVVTGGAMWGLFERTVSPLYLLGLLLLGLAALLFARREGFDLYGLSAVTLALNGLLVAGLIRLVFDNGWRDPILPLLFIGLVAAGLLAASVSAVLRRARAVGAMDPVVISPEGRA